MDIAIIGGGIGGLSAAITLAAAGKPVELFEKQNQLGGKANTRWIGAYRFDTGPSLLTLPQVFSTLFKRAGRTVEPYIPIVPLSPLTQYWFADGTHFASDRLDRFIPTLTQNLDVTERESARYFSYAKKIWDLTHHVFLEQSLHRPKTYFSRDTLHSFLRLGSIDLRRSMHTANAHFFKDPRMVQLLDRYATYNGSDPYQAPATLNNIAYVEHGLGGYGVKNGIYGIISGMERLARELGVEIHTNTPVRKIKHANRNDFHLVLDDKTVGAKALISDVDVSTLYEHLLDDPQSPLAKRYRSLPPSSSALVFYWGINRTFAELGVHNIFFSADYQKEFAQIHQDNKIPSEPTIYINITSKITPTDAPSGGENWFVLVNAPPHDGRDWKQELAKTREQVINRISAVLHTDIAQLIVAEESWTPEQIEQETGSFRGSLYGISSNTRIAAFLRHPNVSKRYPGLYLCGGSVHPGGGMPLSALSGMIAADLLLEKEEF
jgi:phytoene desaturase